MSCSRRPPSADAAALELVLDDVTVRRLEAQATRRGVEIGQLLLEIITTAADSPLDEAVQAASGGR